jgi:hypothetical protein
VLFVWRRSAAPGGLAAATSAAVCTLVRAELITLRGTQLPAFGILIAYLRLPASGHHRCIEYRSARSCDVRLHIVSEYVEGGWLMPET